MKSDMADMKADLKEDIAEVKSDMAELRADFKEDIAEVKSGKADLKTENAELRADIREIRQLLYKNVVDTRGKGDNKDVDRN